EDLYLSALDVTFERFRFDTQFFGGSEIFFTADGRDRSGSGNASSLLAVSPARPGNRWRAERLTATGGELVVGFANSLVWQFAGPDNYNSTTLLDFSILQPLLRAGGRTVVLERLTIAERALLANVRQMERYRRGFYVSVLTGRDPGQGPSRRGGFFGGAGLEGFSGVGGGGFGRVGGFGGGLFGGGGGGFTGGAGAASAGGYLGLLQNEQELRNQRANVAALRASVVQLQATFEAGRIDRFQVDLAKQALYNAQSQLLTAENSFQSTVENFQLDIGLPPELDLAVRDPLLDRFNLLDPSLESLKNEVAQMLDLLRGRREQLADAGPDDPALTAELDAELIASRAAIERLVGSIQEQMIGVESDFEQLENVLPQRRTALAQLAAREEVRQAEIDSTLLSTSRLDQYIEGRKEELARLTGVFAKTSSDLTELAASPAESTEAELDNLIRTLGRTAGELLELSLLQASVRLESVTIEPIELAPPEALAIASAYRRDWKNARANLVDSWRLIYFNANDLESDLDLIFSGDIGNVGQNPFDLRGSNGRLRVGLQFDAPLTRVSERNLYRQSLIEYQQARRGYYEFRDRVYLQLRNELRQLRLNEINLELRRAAVQLAISQVDLTQLRLSEPPKPGETAEFGDTTARDLVQSLSDLLNVQNDFLSVWVNYEVQQLGLEFDLGLMELDSRGTRLETGVPYTAYLDTLPAPPSDLHPGKGCMPPDLQFSAAEPPAELQFMPGVEMSGPELLPTPAEE
ncbi:MAG: TolC family protein, partial [Aeoliella sp.]